MVKVISLGNQLRGDDSIGPLVVEQLRKIETPVPLCLIDAGSDAFRLLEHLIDEEPVIIIDCAKMGKKPGQAIKFKVADSEFKPIEKSISLHGFSFSEVLAMAGNIGKIADCTIIGIEPKSIDFGKELSEEVKLSIPAIINMVIEEAKKYGS